MQNIHQIKEEICDIGRRIYNKGFAAANDGNISYRVDENRVVCTPTQFCKGFLKPEDLCVVDMEGNQLSGFRKRTSEIFLHLTIMKKRPEVKSVVHCHPPHATAFGIAREAIPQCVLPEVDIYMGDVPITKYAIPGGQEFADTVLPFIHKTDIVVLANHGTVSYGATVEKAYWLTELLDAYCRILLLARSLGYVGYFNKDEAEDLLQLKQKWGIKDPRAEAANCELCANDMFRESWKETGVGHRAFQPPTFKRGNEPTSCGCVSNPILANNVELGKDPGQEAIIKAITDRVMEALKQK
ncbi:MAG: class II aldolase/adducin family protein [Thermoguttaceae bacterium]|nr:class II aldolase/adducin family protein [Thermoguttaceae bacterium]MBQ3332774.1 class II aldolase/adducin family protein [Thermoguttaceae bacterium]MBQ6619522.1 class II aldolase/adducin family protein [Thermoguttaceae bacterium]MBR2584150.1 class II aldolase/adducin family protein [Thermoguttaceae bacterium]